LPLIYADERRFGWDESIAKIAIIAVIAKIERPGSFVGFCSICVNLCELWRGIAAVMF
jgi:hypothetical protein